MSESFKQITSDKIGLKLKIDLFLKLEQEGLRLNELFKQDIPDFNNLMALDRYKAHLILEKSPFFITFHDVSNYKPMYINNAFMNYYGFKKNWFDKVDYNYYLKTIHISTVSTLVESISHFRKGGYGALNLEYLLKSRKGEWTKFIGSTITIHRDQNEKPITAITVGLQLIDQSKSEFKKLDNLTKRETEIAHLLSQGKTRKQIAVFASISEHTIQTHIKNIYKKLEIHKVSELSKVLNDY